MIYYQNTTDNTDAITIAIICINSCSSVSVRRKAVSKPVPKPWLSSLLHQPEPHNVSLGWVHLQANGLHPSVKVGEAAD